MIRVLLVDDIASIREEMQRLLELEEDIQVIGEAADGWEAIERTTSLQPDLILIDKTMPSLDGIEATRLIKKDHPQARIIFLAAEDTWRTQALAAGAEAYFLKDESPEELIRAVREGNGLRREVAFNLSLLGRRLQAAIDSIPREKPILIGAPLALLLAGFVIMGGGFFALIGLTLGLFFFAYALKYYATIALILLFNGENGLVNGNGHLQSKGLRNGFWNGLRKIFTNGVENAFANGYNLKPEAQPFVSIHLPLYNEKEVVDRLLAASTSLDYENYEVIVADDSTDETTDILEQRWAEHPRVKISHRQDRSGFKGGALEVALQRTDPCAEFIVIFDADFIPPPDVITRFLAYFYSENGDGQRYADDRVAVVQGYQWHMLNASENWITRGIRVEFSGSYVIERPGQELLGSMKMISGSVFMIRADVLRKHGWGISITEDWELTLRLYLDGYKVLYTPFIQAPAECISDFRQLTRQRMRWARGHTFNVKRYFWRVLTSPKISWREKAEFLYYAPYYLQSILFILGTACWFISELILHRHIPYWTALLGWSLVFSNLFSLVLMNLSGLFLERGVKHNWSGIFSFIALSNLLVPFQAYAALKGLLEKDEGGWHRTPKSGRITEVLGRLRFGKKLRRLLPKGKRRRLPERAPALVRQMPIEGLGLSVRVFNRLKSAGITDVGEVLERLRRGDEALLTIRGFGPKSLEEVQAALQATPIDELGLSERLVKALKRVRVSRIGRLLARMEAGEKSLISIKGIGPASLEQMKSALDQAPLEIIGLSTRVHNRLKGAETTTLGQLLQRMENSKMALLSIRNFGPKSLQELREALQRKGSLGAPTEPLPAVERATAPVRWPMGRRLRTPALITVSMAILLALFSLALFVPIAAGNPDLFYLHDDGIGGVNPWERAMDTAAPSGGIPSTLQIRKNTDLYWYSPVYPSGNDDGGIVAGDYTFTMYLTDLPGSGKSVTFRVHVGLVNPDGSGYENITTSALQTVDSSTTSPMEISLGSGAAQTFTVSNPNRNQLPIEGISSQKGGNCSIQYDATSTPSSLDTPSVTVPEGAWSWVLLAPFIPLLISVLRRYNKGTPDEGRCS